MNKLLGKVIVIVNNKNLISRSTAKLAKKEGASVILTCSVDESLPLQRTKDISSIFKHDPTSTKSWHILIKKIVKRYGRIDSLITSSGTELPPMLLHPKNKELLFFKKTEMHRIKTVFKTVLPVMLNQGGGSIINISAIDTLKLATDTSTYYSEQDAFHSLISRTSEEYVDKGIRINTICPSLTKTPILEYHSSIKHVNYRNSVPFPYFKRPLDVASAIVYLSSDEASFITGSKLVLNGGKMV